MRGCQRTWGTVHEGLEGGRKRRPHLRHERCAGGQQHHAEALLLPQGDVEAEERLVEAGTLGSVCGRGCPGLKQLRRVDPVDDDRTPEGGRGLVPKLLRALRSQ